MTNPLIDAWNNGRQTYGFWTTMPGSVAAEIIARQDVDYVSVDYQHGLLSIDAGIPMIQAITAAGKPAVARVPWNEPSQIMHVLDLGVDAVIVPMVDSAADARKAASATLYPPRGSRSYGPVRAREILGSAKPEDLEHAALMVMVETAGAVRDIEEIAQVPGVTGVYIGPSDLSLALGYDPSNGPTEAGLQHTVESILATCQKHGIFAGIHCPNGAVARRYAELGFDMLTIGSDSSTLASAVRREAQAARGTSTPAISEIAQAY